MSEQWNIRELTAIVQHALQHADYEGQTSGRVRSTPDSRTIRYYTTLGLLDPPLAMRGRTAFYGRRHVLQIAAIKRLQAGGLTLAEVQRQLPGATTEQLTTWAGLPATFWATVAPGPAAPASRTTSASDSPRAGNFWQQQPADAAADDSENGENAEAADRAAANETPAVHGPAGVVLRLTPELSFIVEGRTAHTLNEEKLAAITPLLNRLIEELDTGNGT